MSATAPATAPAPARTVLANARVVTADEVVHGSIAFDRGGIVSVDPGATAVNGAIDCEGDLVIPGLIEMHTDNVERHMEPRPGVMWPSSISALLAHDAQLVGAGITTVFDAISVGDHEEGGRRKEMLKRTVDGLKYGREHGLFRGDHLMHMRCEVSDQAVVDIFKRYVNDPIVRLVSVMDHTPGQRQWRDLEKMRTFHSRKRSYTDDEFSAFIASQQEKQARYAESHRREVLALWRPRGLPTASHDDTTEEHVAEAVRDGITIAEFPTTLDAARLAHAHGLYNVMGSPNLVRGGSHSGNVSAGELADNEVLHALSSDYMPVSLLHGALKLADDHRYSLPAAIASVTSTVAEMVALDDRGQLAPGKRADVVRVRPLSDGSGAVRAVWREGRQVN